MSSPHERHSTQHLRGRGVSGRTAEPAYFDSLRRWCGVARGGYGGPRRDLLTSWTFNLPEQNSGTSGIPVLPCVPAPPVAGVSTVQYSSEALWERVEAGSGSLGAASSESAAGSVRLSGELRLLSRPRTKRVLSPELQECMDTNERSAATGAHGKEPRTPKR